ncbi:MAG: tRNA epoxyqueuosine(34) reductase QueG [Planctomycetota bacterium]
MTSAAQDILDAAEAQGFALAGIASAEPSEHADAVRDWVAEGKHGTMRWIENHLDVRLDLQKLLPGANSVIGVCDAYASGADLPGAGDNDPDRPRGRIARYAWGDDYHKVMKKRLHKLADSLAEQYPDHGFRSAVDTAPALEREIAARAGLGWQAKNTMLIHPRHGSYTLLGLVVTTMELPTSKQMDFPGATLEATDHCANCTRCIDACPTDAIAKGGYSIDASRCVSYLTIEHRGLIANELRGGMGDWIAGCDVCQEVCPYNKIGERHPLKVNDRYEPSPRKFNEGLDLLDILTWTADDRARVFQGSALKRIKLDMIRRNAIIAIGNVLDNYDEAEQQKMLDAVRACNDDESEIVSVTARQILAQHARVPA